MKAEIKAKAEELADKFIKWRDNLHREQRGGQLMFDVPNHYKWIEEDELFTYYMNHEINNISICNTSI
ncbi:MAG TPA: hypothetical protein PLY25_10780 [Bacteroidia bacterium]|nr:hypothetical protein [Bacteroidia bacterium]